MTLLGLLLASALSPLPADVQSPEAVVIMRKTISGRSLSEIDGGWTVGPWLDVSAQCGVVRKTRSVVCGRTDGACMSPRPDDAEDGFGTATDCPFSWSTSGFGQWNSSCSPNAVRQRVIACVDRRGNAVEDDRCEIAFRPDPVDFSARYDSCSFVWDVGAWSGSCLGAVPRIRTATCMVDVYRIRVEDSRCGPKPVTVQQVSDPDRCDNQWSAGTWSDWSSHCSDKAVRSRAIRCIDDAGRPTDDARCLSNIRPEAVQISQVTDACTVPGVDLNAYRWTASPFGEWSSQCSPISTRSRMVSCVAPDGTSVESSKCSSASRPSSSEIKPIYDGCTVGWNADAWSGWSAMCVENATRTRSVRCERTDGDRFTERLSDDACASPRPDVAETGPNYDGCVHRWKVGAGSVTPSCGPTLRTSPVVCQRIVGSVALDAPDASCSDPKPTGIEPADDYSTCSYGWTPGEWSPWSSSCSMQASRSRELTCTRIQIGDKAPNEKCGEPIASVEKAPILSGCSYAWRSMPAGEWSQTDSCASEQTRNVNVACIRSDGETVDDASCSGSKPPSVETKPLPGCSYAWASTYAAERQICGSSSRSGTITCVRQDGASSPEGKCDPATRPALSIPYTNYDGCAYAWEVKPLAAWDSTCAANARRTVSVSCVRSDGVAAVSDSSCTAVKPSSTESGVNTSGCSTVFGNMGFEVAGSWAGDANFFATNFPSPAGGRVSSLNNGTSQLSSAPLKYTSRYRLEFYAINANFSGYVGTVIPRLQGGGGYSSSISEVSPSSGWSLYTVTFTPNAGAVDSSGRLTLSLESNARGVWIDGLKFYAVAN